MQLRTTVGMALAVLVPFHQAMSQERAPSAVELQQRAVARLTALADRMDRETTLAATEFAELNRSTPGGEYAIILDRTVRGLQGSGSVITKNVLATPDAKKAATDAILSPDNQVSPVLARTQLSGAVSEQLGAHKADIAYVRALAQSLKSAPAKSAVATLNAAYLPPTVERFLDPGPTSVGTAPKATTIAYYATASGRVVGRAKPTVDYPSVVQIMQDFGSRRMSTICTGTLIAPHVVLSAAHCFCQYDQTQHYLKSARACRAGTFERDDGSKVNALGADYRRVYFQHAGLRKIARIEINDAFAFPHADLAIVTLQEDVSGIQPTRLIANDPVKPGETATIVGFGRHSPLDSAGRPLAMHATSNEAGLKFWARTRIGNCTPEDSTKRLLCWTYDAGETGGFEYEGNTCNGDSGGPLFAQRGDALVLAGVTSGGVNRSCGANDYSFDVDVHGFRDWILARVAANSPRATPPSDVGSLGPHVGNYKSFVLFTNWTRFDLQRPAWEDQFDVPAGTRMLRFGVNSHALNSTSPLRIWLWNPSGTSVCDVRSNDNALMCPRIDVPAAGRWRFVVDGPAGLDFQGVATAFARQVP